MDALLAYSDDDDDGTGNPPSVAPSASAAARPPQTTAAHTRPAAAKPAGVVVFKLPSMRSAAAGDDDEDAPPPPVQPEDAGAKRARDGDRKSAFLSSLPAPKNAAKTSLIPVAGAPAAPTAVAARAADTAGNEPEFEVDAAAYSSGGDDDSDASDAVAAAHAGPQLDAEEDAPALGPSYPPPDYYAQAYPEVEEDGAQQEYDPDYSNPMFDQSVPVEGTVTCFLARQLTPAAHLIPSP